MGRSYFADIPGNFQIANLGTVAAVASNAAAIRSADISFVAPAEIKLVSAWRVMKGTAEGTASSAASYRPFKLMNGGTSGSATANLLAVVNCGAVAGPAALAATAFDVQANATMAAGEVMWASAAASVGAARDGATDLAAASLQIAYELL